MFTSCLLGCFLFITDSNVAFVYIIFYSEPESKAKFTIIRDLYNTGHYAIEILEEHLENALESQVEHIVIEALQVGDETSKWIQVGNCLHKLSVLSGLSCLLSPLVCPDRYQLYLTLPLSSVNLVCTTLYDLSWQYDPCCKYQVEHNTRRLEQLQLQTLSTSMPVVLVRRDDKYRKRLHNFLSACVLSYVGWKAYQFYKS